MSKTLRNVGTSLKNPTVQKILAWVLPLIFGWILSKLDTKPKDDNRKK
jgi:hypothetical protein